MKHLTMIQLISVNNEFKHNRNFDNQGMGVCLLGDQYDKIVINLDHSAEADINGNVKQFSHTFLNDRTDAQFDMAKSIKGCCLWSELDNFIYSGRKLESSFRE